MASERQEFKQTEVDDLLAKCHRRCCICHRFCGVKIELHHIDGATKPGAGRIENAIPLCFDCHAEVKHYNPTHRRGRKFQPAEIRKHRDQWLKICQKTPEALFEHRGPADVGPLQATLDELEFNLEVARRQGEVELGAMFFVAGFQRAIEEGLLCLLGEQSRDALITAYATMMKANTLIHASFLQQVTSLTRKIHTESGQNTLRVALPQIENAIKELRQLSE
jgi:hypothetical protein